MENSRKAKILSVIAIVALVTLIVGATFAYFTAQGGSATSKSLNVTTYTTDVFTFTTGDEININADQSTFAKENGNAAGSTFAKASLTANNKTNTATETYNVYINISDNNFKYSINSSTPELLLTIKDANNNEITSISGLEHKTVTDGKGASVSGFDITTKTGLLTLIDNREIVASPTKEEQWNITITFVNYNSDQSDNAGKTFEGQVLISKDTFDEYTPNTINTLSTTKSGSNLTVKLNVDEGTNEIDKYYFAITEKKSVAMLDTSVMKLSNKLAATTPAYVESTSSSYTFSNVKENANYEILAYAVDKNKIKTNTYKYNFITDSYVYPTISNVDATFSNTSLVVSITADKGTNNISKYYYSIDNGNSYVESTSNSYTFSNLISGSNYRIIVKVMDTNNKYSNIYVVNGKTSSSITLANYIISQYNGVQGNNNIYYHNANLANGAGDNSYRYAGSSDTTNNYVCFGSTESPCPEDNLYRIIGVFDGQVKLIKYDYANSNLLGTDGDFMGQYEGDSSDYKGTNIANVATYCWNNSTQTNRLHLSELHSINLNTNFLENIGNNWANKIAITRWQVAGDTYDNIVEVVPAKAFQNEITDMNENYAQIGLMYVSDYGYAASDECKSTLRNYDTCKDDNWLFLGSREYFVTPYGASACQVYIGGTSVGGEYVDENKYAVRPVLYLKPNIKIISGNGTSDNPYEFSIS